MAVGIEIELALARHHGERLHDPDALFAAMRPEVLDLDLALRRRPAHQCAAKMFLVRRARTAPSSLAEHLFQLLQAPPCSAP